MAIRRGSKVNSAFSSASMTDLMFSITSDLQYYVETVPVRFDDLETILRGKLEGAEQPTLSLHADKSVPIDNVVKVMNIAKDNKWTLILATSPN